MKRVMNWWLICGWIALAPSVFAASQTDSVTVGYSSFAGAYGPLWIAVEEQLGRKHGLELKAIYAGRIRPQQLLASGEVPFVVATGTGALSSHILGVKDQVIILTFINKVGSGVIAKADIKSPEELRGKTIATGRPGAFADPWFDMYCGQNWAWCRTATSSCCRWAKPLSTFLLWRRAS